MTTEVLPVIRNYQIVRAVGSGGMSTVYEAIDSNLKRTVAIKVLHSHLHNDGAAQERFRREALSAAALNHPNIVHVIDYIYAGTTHCIIMEYLSGPDMEALLKRRACLAFETVRFIMFEVAKALEEAHKQGVLHRDVKPSNILLHNGNRVVLTDFGLARRTVDSRLTQHDAVAGTPLFMSPEQIGSREIDAATDVYSWAVTFHNLMSGSLPYAHQGFAEAVGDIQNGRTVLDPVVRQGVPGKYLAVLEKCLVADPLKRLRNGGELIKALSGCGEMPAVDLREYMISERPKKSMPISERDISVTQIYRAHRGSPLKGVLVIVLLIAAVAGLFAGALWYVDSTRTSAPAPEAASLVVATQANVTQPAPVTDTAAVALRETDDTVVVPTRISPVLRTRPPVPAPPDSGQLFIHCDPWANIDINGRYLGRTPLEKPIFLPRGKHLIRLYNDFCEPLEDEVEITSRGILRRRYTLKVKPAYR